MTEPATSQRRSVKSPAIDLLLLLPPVLERELRVALHRRDARKARFKVARAGVIGVSLFLLLGAIIGTAAWGTTLHFFLFIAGLALAVGPALQISVGLYADERRQQTLELLYLTGMGSAELFLGKLLGGILVSSSELLALAPLMAVPFLSGGVSFELFLQTAACLPTVFVLVTAFGALASALCRQEGTALILAGVLLGGCCLALPLPYSLGSWLAGKVPFDKAWLALSPALGPWMIANAGGGGFRVGDFWTCTLVTWTWSLLGLVLAAVALKHNWRRDLQRPVAEGWRAKWESLALGSAAWRTALRRRVLDFNAYQWLAQQDRRAVLQAWGFIAAVCAFWLLGWLTWQRLWPTPANFYSTALVLLVGLDVLAAYAAARRMTADRRDGGLELLLTTPLTPREILAGQKAALQQQFVPVKRGLCGLFLVMVVAGLCTRTWTRPALVSYFVVWSLFFAWCWRSARRSAPLAMWVAANCGQPLYSVFRRKRGWGVYWLWLMSGNFAVFGGFRRIPNGSKTEVVVAAAVVLWVMMLGLATRTQADAIEDPLVSQLRLIAQEPLPERNDPRFKAWKDIRTRFPPPPGGRAGYPGEDMLPGKTVKAAGVWFWKPLGRICGLAWGKLMKAGTSPQGKARSTNKTSPRNARE